MTNVSRAADGRRLPPTCAVAQTCSAYLPRSRDLCSRRWQPFLELFPENFLRPVRGRSGTTSAARGNIYDRDDIPGNVLRRLYLSCQTMSLVDRYLSSLGRIPLGGRNASQFLILRLANNPIVPSDHQPSSKTVVIIVGNSQCRFVARAAG